MTNARVVLAVAFALLGMTASVAPRVAAHGAAEAREIDLRVLLDDDGGLGYGGCGPSEEAGAPCTPAPDGLDVLALDVREAWLGDEPAIVFRMIVQSASVHDGRGLLLALTANGAQGLFRVASPDGVNYTSSDFDLLEGPFDVGDGFPKAVDGWLRLSTLGVNAGDEVTGIHLDSTHHDEPDDAMPGTYYSNGVQMPHLPHGADPGEALEDHLPGTYAVKGPAPLLTFELTPGLLDLGRSGNLTLRLGNALAATAQSVTVTIPASTTARFAGGASNATVSLDPGATRDLILAWPAGAAAENATLVATSDLGAREVRSVLVVPVPTSTNTTTQAPAKDTPGTAFAPLALAVLGMAVLVRRRR